MRSVIAAVFSVAFGAGMFAGATFTAHGQARQPSAETQCGSASAPRVRTTLYFGLARPNGSVSELEWQLFLRDEVTARFPDGLTVWEAAGQWRRADGAVDHEQTKVLLLVHSDTSVARQAVQSVIERYRKKFEQQSVLWETARVCATA